MCIRGEVSRISRETAGLTLAVAMHAGIALSLPLREPTREERADEVIELTIVPEEAAKATLMPSTFDGATSLDTPRATGASRISTSWRTAPGVRHAEASSAPAGTTRAEDARDTSEASGQSGEAFSPFSLPLGPDVLGIGANSFLRHRPDEKDAGSEEPPKKVAVFSVDRAREASLGMAPDGPARRELAQATRLGRTPVNGRAVFRVTIGPDGLVTRVEVTDHTDVRDVWDEVARATEVALSGTRQRLSVKSRGVILLVEISSELQLPSGRAVGRLPKVTVGAGTVSTAVDITDIGARSVRVVHTRLLDRSDPD